MMDELTRTLGVNDGRTEGPLLKIEQWDRILSKSSFNGTETVADDFNGIAHKVSLIVSSLDTDNNKPNPAHVTVLSLVGVDSHSGLKEQLVSKIKHGGAEIYQTVWDANFTLDPNPGAIYLVMDLGENPLLSNPSSDQFQQITNLLTHAERVFWLCGFRQPSACINAQKGLIKGFAGTARGENPKLRLITFDIQEESVQEEELVQAIHDAFHESLQKVRPDDDRADYDYIFRGGEILIPRLFPDAKANDVLSLTDTQSVPESVNFHQQGRAFKLRVEKPGLLDSLIFVDDELAESTLPSDSVEIQVAAFGINFKDVFISLGQMKHSARMAGECAGTVVRVGSKLEAKFRVGDRVCCFDATPYASRARVRGHCIHPIPDSMTYAVAASIPVVFSTSYHGLINVGKLEANQSVLIHAAAGGVGQSAIKIAQHIGAEIFATVGSAAKRNLLMDQYNIPSDHIFSSKDRKFRHGILRMTRGKGVDVVLNSSTGESLYDSWRCLANFGTFVEIGKRDIYNKSLLQMEVFEKNTTFAAIDLSLLSEHRPKEVREVLGSVMEMFEQGQVTPVEPITTFPIGDIELAFRYIQTRKQTGKVVLEADATSIVKATASEPPKLSLDSNGTYIIAGGMGDLGRHTARRFAARGAGSIVLLSRSQSNESDIRTIKDEIHQLGSEVHVFRCDITSASAVEEVMEYCEKHLPPIKGIMQAVMALQVRSLRVP
jgi:NADPH:quinone reductase-like Zn-dependent oxidoreductase